MIFGVLRGLQTKWYLNVLVGVIYAIIYYIVFKFVILKFNIKTPGRAGEEDDLDSPLSAGELGLAVMEALGGKENILEIDNCISRLRLILKDTKLANEQALKMTGSLGVIKIDESFIHPCLSLISKKEMSSLRSRSGGMLMFTTPVDKKA